MKKLITIFLAFVTMVVLCYAQRQNVVAVVPFTYKAVSGDDAETITELVTSEYAVATSATVVDRNHFEAMKEQQRFELTDWSDVQKIAQLGKALNAIKVLCGQVRKLGNKITVNVRVIDVNTTAIYASATKCIEALDDFMEVLPAAARQKSVRSDCFCL